ncbi:hypothetical protein F5883DRAFT_105911 [Diaporthe sp. PMI_573]|jgi:hypothetical protein|nr:hypothetical protein F5883DRAFT_105911 [Diaporthaceae sp. PMI_573]
MWHAKQYGKFCDPAFRCLSQRRHARSTSESLLVWLLAATHPAEGDFVPGHRGTLPPGPIKHAVGRPRKMERCNGAKENGLLLSSPPFPVLLPPPIPGVHGSPSFAEMWSKIVWGRGGENRLTWTACDSGRAGSNLSRIRKLVRCDGWMARIYLGSARRPVHPAPSRTTQINIEREERTTLRLIPRVSLAACAIVMRLDLGGRWSRWADRR